MPLADPPDLSAPFTLVIPNHCDIMGSCSTGSLVTNGDTWLSAELPKLLDSSQYRAGGTAIFLTWDEDDYSDSQHVATLVIAPSTPTGARDGTRYDHYALLRTAEEMLGLPTTLGSAATAPSMRGGFNL